MWRTGLFYYYTYCRFFVFYISLNIYYIHHTLNHLRKRRSNCMQSRHFCSFQVLCYLAEKINSGFFRARQWISLIRSVLSDRELSVTRIRVEHMERQLANLTGLVQKALTHAPHTSPSPREYLQVPPGRDPYARAAGTCVSRNSAALLLLGFFLYFPFSLSQ